MTDLEKIAASNSWPLWPRLPVKRWRENELPQIGYLLAGSFDVTLGNVFASMSAAEGLVRYESAKELVTDGWLVD